jgi:outer membrane protein OmpA-like peptidoglycan-associated protein
MRRRPISDLTRALPVPLLAFALAACASSPPGALVRAEAAYQEAAADPQVVAHAPVALHEAEQTLDRARAALDEDEESEVEHLAYLASRRVEIARELARRDAARATAEELAQRQQVVAAETRAELLARELELLQARETERGIVLNLSDVLFEVDRAELQPGVLPDLGRLAEFLRANPDRPVLIEGHTDSTGTSEYNLQLSEARAAAVESALVQQGVPPARIQTRAFGESAPVASNDTAAGRQQNRRVEIVIANPPAVGAR